MPIELVISEHIEITDGICGGRPRIVGHRIKVQDVAVWHEEMGLSPREIVHRYPTLTLADVYAALAYYHDHQTLIQQHIQQDEALVESLKASIPSKLPQES